jgi:hypothetical protein
MAIRGRQQAGSYFLGFTREIDPQDASQVVHRLLLQP